MTTQELDHIVGIRAVLLVVVALVTVGMAARGIYAFRKLSLGQKLFFIGATCMTAYAADAMRDAIQAGLGWKWRLILGMVGSAALFGWLLEPVQLQRRLWGRPSMLPPPDMLAGLAVTREEFKGWVEQVTDYAIIALSLSGDVQTWSAGAEKLKGYKAHEILGKSFETFYTPEDRAAGVPKRLLATALQDGRVEATGWRVRKDGTRFWGDIVITLIRDENDVPVGFVKIVRDLDAPR